MSSFMEEDQPISSATVRGLELHLTSEEEALFDLLLRSIAYHGKKSILRVAGGWVRDKILDKQSNDIDIALDDQSGIDFANGVNAYLQTLGMETRTIAVIMANPDQSKHLETANLRVLGFEIDCVHLRAETYSDTRIPEIRVGTALEDALRRDFNINSLFYNINERCVEDFTGRGVQDLQQGILCTPLPADITFHDDPLRVFRAIRFASRLNYALDMSLITAARQPAIRSAIQHKVSRERICKEIDGMLQHSNARPGLSAILLHHLQMLDVCMPLQLYLLSTDSAGSALVDGEVCATAPIPQYRVSQPCHALCTPWFDASTQSSLLPCSSCVHGREHVPKDVSCWMSMSVEVSLWLQAFVSQKYHLIGQGCGSTLDANSWLVHFQQSRAWFVQHNDLFEVCALHNQQCEVENNAKILFWSSLLSVTAGSAIQEKHTTTVSAATVPAASAGKKGHQTHSQQQHSVKDFPVSERLLREQLKMDNHTAKGSQIVIDAAFSLLRLLQLDSIDELVQAQGTSLLEYQENSLFHASLKIASSIDIMSIAQWLRTVKERWEDAVLLAISFLYAWVHRQLPSYQGLYQPYSHENATLGLVENIKRCFEDMQASLSSATITNSSLLFMIIDRFAAFIQAMQHFRLQEIWLLKPLLDGSAMQRHLEGKIPKGPMIGKLMEAQTLWLIQYRFTYATVEETTQQLVLHLRHVLAEEIAGST